MAAPRDGIIAALWTPTDSEGRIQADALKHNLEFALGRGVGGLMVAGSTGEFPHLSVETRKELLQLAKSHAPRLPMIANISDIRPSVVAALGRCARSLGFESVTLLAPWFFPVAQADLVEFFVRGAEAASLPLFLYNFPERTGNRIALETIDAVAGRVEVAGVKQSGDEFEYHKDLVALGRARGFVVFTGGEPRLGEAMRLGVAGCVSGLANAVPELVAGLYTAVKAGDSSAETLATERIRRLCAELDRLQFPLNVAAAIEARGLAAGVPKSAISSATCQQYRLLAADLRGLYRQWQML